VSSQNHRGEGLGESMLRKEDDRLLRGDGCFLDDVPVPMGTLTMTFVRSPHAHAIIKQIDVSAAKAIDGVVDVLTGDDLAELLKPIFPDLPLPGFRVVQRELVCRDRVRYVGDIVAVVLADTPYIAEDALDLIEVDYEPLPVVSTAKAARAPGAQRVHDDAPDNIAFQHSFKTPDFDPVFSSADHVLKEKFRSERVAVVSMEARGCLAIYDRSQNGLTFWTSTQIPHMVRTAIAEALVLPIDNVRVICPDTGGGFGMKTNVYPEEFIAAALAKKYRGAVKWVQDRQDDFLTSTHARDFDYEVEMAFSGTGVLQAARLKMTVNIGAYGSFPFGSSLESGGGPRTFPGPYKFSNYAFETYSIFTHTSPTSAFRGVAAPVSFFCMEGMMDRIARFLKLDPAEVRRRNLVKAEDFPYVNANGIRYDTGTYVECMERAIELIDYNGLRQEYRASRLKDGKYRGIGISVITEQTGQGGARYKARGLLRIPGIDGTEVRIEANGQATVAISHTTQGQGHLTTFAQLAASHLGLKVADVTIIEGDTQRTPFGTGTFASRGAVTGGGSIIRSATVVANKVKRIAAYLLGAEPDEIILRNGFAEVLGPAHKGIGNRRVSILEIAEIAHSMSTKTLPPGETHGLISTEFYDPPVPAVSNAAHIACVTVDAATARVDVEKYVVVHDCGLMINPMIVEGQTHGAVAHGLGPALMERIVYDEEGQLLTTTLLDYVIPTAHDIPNILLDHFETPAIDTLGGIKGVAEGGTIGAIPAIANAISDALSDFDISINHIPVRPDELLGLMKKQSKK
jgi:aerobic carbon-monoxide dehydrogenase large subunit